MKYQIGDVIHTIDGIDYNGDSITYSPGVDTEIIGYEGDQYCIRDFYRTVTEDEIQKLVITNIEKCKQYEKELAFYGKNIFIQTGLLSFEEVTIQYYSFEYHKFTHIKICGEKEHHLQIDKFWKTELDAYKKCYEKSIEKLHLIRKLTN